MPIRLPPEDIFERRRRPAERLSSSMELIPARRARRTTVLNEAESTPGVVIRILTCKNIIVKRLPTLFPARKRARIAGSTPRPDEAHFFRFLLLQLRIVLIDWHHHFRKVSYEDSQNSCRRAGDYYLLLKFPQHSGR